MCFHMDSKEAAIAHLYFSGFIPMTAKGHEHKWRLRDKTSKLRAQIQNTEGSEIVMICIWMCD